MGVEMILGVCSQVFWCFKMCYFSPTHISQWNVGTFVKELVLNNVAITLTLLGYKFVLHKSRPALVWLWWCLFSTIFCFGHKYWLFVDFPLIDLVDFRRFYTNFHNNITWIESLWNHWTPTSELQFCGSSKVTE